MGKDKLVTLRINEKVYELVKRRAESLDLTFSEYVRGMSTMEFILENLHQRMLKIRKKESFDETEYMKIVEELSKHLGILNSVHIRYNSLQDKIFDEINKVTTEENQDMALAVYITRPVKINRPKQEVLLEL